MSDVTTPVELSAAAESAERTVDETIAQELVERARSEGVELVGPGGLLTGLTKTVLETALEAEMDEHLGYARHAVEGRNTGNSRNGTRAKTVLTEVGEVEVGVPRDREGSFDPKIVRKRQRRMSGVDELVISLAAKGLTTGEVAAHLADVYGAEVSRDTISRITDAVVEELGAWQSRPLDPVYPVVFIDAIHVKIRDGKVANRPIYTVVGVTVNGERDILGLWVGDGSEGAKYWHQVLSEILNRGTVDVCIVCCDGLKGLPDAIADVWPQAIVQTCVLHLIRNSFRYASKADWAELAKDLGPSTAPRPKQPRRRRSTSSPASGETATRRSSSSGRTPGPSSSRSSPTAPRSARSSIRPTRSRACTPASAAPSASAATSPTSRPL
jgi:transposase-like protein